MVLAALSSTVFASTPSTQWGPCSLTPMTLAKRTDEKLHTMVHTGVEYLYNFRLPSGRGNLVGMAAVKTQKVFRIQDPVIGTREQDIPKLESFVANGGKMSTVLGTGKDMSKPSVGPIPKYRKLPPDLLATWLRNNVRCLFKAIGSKTGVLEKLVQEAQTTPGYQVVSSERNVPLHLTFSGGRTRNYLVTQYRILVKRTPQATKTHGELYYEVVVSKYFLPITMNNLYKPGKTAFSTSMFQTKWDQSVTQYPPYCFDLKAPFVEIRKISG
jgi:hypothetical protein